MRRLFRDGPLQEKVALVTGASRGVGKGVALGLAEAVRSSATAEDLPDKSFAGQRESYLNVHGATAALVISPPNTADSVIRGINLTPEVKQFVQDKLPTRMLDPVFSALCRAVPGERC